MELEDRVRTLMRAGLNQAAISAILDIEPSEVVDATIGIEVSPAAGVFDRAALYRSPGVITETFQRANSPATQGTMLQGRMSLAAIPLPAGKRIQRARFSTQGSAVTAPTNQWCALIRPSDRLVLSKSNNKLAEAWNVNEIKTFDGLDYTPAVDELAWVGIVVTGGGNFNYLGLPHGNPANIPMICGTLNGPFTTPAAFPATAPLIGSLTDPIPWCELAD